MIIEIIYLVNMLANKIINQNMVNSKLFVNSITFENVIDIEMHAEKVKNTVITYSKIIK